MTTKRADVDWPTVLKLMGGGVALGGGVGAASSLVRYLTAMNQKAKAKRDSSRDDDVLYLNLPAKQASGDRGSASTFAFGGLGSLLGAYLAYNAVRGIYGKARRKQLQTELDAAQNAYLTNLNQTATLQKQASQFSGVSKVVGSGYLAGLLTILGSAVLTNKILQKQFPVRRSARPDSPRKIVVRTVRPGGMEKEVPMEDGGISPDGIEGLAKLNLGSKRASWGLTDLVAAVAQGRGEEFKTAAKTAGIDAAFDLIKGASVKESSAVANNLAVSWIAHDPFVSEAIAPYLAAQFHQDSPTFFKVACSIEDAGEQYDLIGLVEEVARETRKSAFAPVLSKLDGELVKKAAVMGKALPMSGLTQNLLVANAINDLLRTSVGSHRGGAEDDKTPIIHSSPTSNDSRDIKKKEKKKKEPVFTVEDEDADQFLAQNKDVIDQALASIG